MENFGIKPAEPRLTLYYRQGTPPRDLFERVTPSLRKEYQKYAKDIVRLNINFPERFSPETLGEIIRNRDNAHKLDSRPTALILYAGEDYNYVFFHNNIINLKMQGYRILYYEITDDREFSRIIRNVGKQNAIDILVVGGHGGEDFPAISLGGRSDEALTDKNEHLFIDYSDRRQFQEDELAGYLKKEGEIILMSCYAGKGKQRQNNMANYFHEIFPYSNISAPVDGVHAEKYFFDEKGKFASVEFYYKTIIEKYSIAGRKEILDIAKENKDTRPNNKLAHLNIPQRTARR